MLKKKKRMLILFFIVIGMICYVVAHSSNANFSNRLIGTYQCEEDKRMAIVCEDEHYFYISDYNNSMYQKGTIEKQTENTYFLSSEETGDYFQNQSITCQKTSFEIIINQKKRKFKKISETPIFTPEIEKLL